MLKFVPNKLYKFYDMDMETMILGFLSDVLAYTWQTLKADGWYLFLSILAAVSMSVYLDPEKTRVFFLKRNRMVMPGSVALGAFTPLCACGTMAVVISLLTTALPWGPIMSFLVSSPLMSPDTFILLSGVLGADFAIALAVASVLLGFFAGYMTIWIEKNTKYLDDQFRVTQAKKNKPAKLTYRPTMVATDCCSSVSMLEISGKQVGSCCAPTVQQSLSMDDAAPANKLTTFLKKIKAQELVKEFYKTGIKKILPLFTLFVVIAFVVKTYVPTEWMMQLFQGNSLMSVPIAALIGLPLYVSDATVVPLLQVLQEGGASRGTLLAFMISGPGTSLAVILGLNVILKQKAILLYIAYVFLGAIVLGYLYDFLV